MEDDVIDGPDLDWEEDAYVEEKALKASMPIAEAIEESKQAAWQKAMAASCSIRVMAGVQYA